MKNITPETSDYFDKFPKQNPMHRHRRDGTKMCGCAWCDEKRSDRFPRNAIKNFLLSRTGKNENDLFSEFKRLAWLPEEYKTYKYFCSQVETNTWLEGNRVKFTEDSVSYFGAEYYIDESRCLIFYIHPTGRHLCHFTPKKHRSKKKKNENFIVLGNFNQLVKIRGIWYRVWINDLNVVKYLKGSDEIIYEDKGGAVKVNSKLNFIGIEVYKKQLDSKTLKLMGLKND